MYPDGAKIRRLQGDTRLRFRISGGKIDSVEVIQSSGPTYWHKRMDSAAAEAMARCPVISGFDRQGNPTNPQVELNFRWRIPDQGAL